MQMVTTGEEKLGEPYKSRIDIKRQLSLQKRMQSLLDKLETSLEKFLQFEICYGKVLIFCRNIYSYANNKPPFCLFMM